MPPTVEELLPDEDLDDLWDRLTTAEQQERLTQLLSEMPKHQRQALMLRDSQGFEIGEIARALDRDEADVEADIQNARARLHAALAATT